MREDKPSPETVTAALQENTRLANTLGVRGVPFYLVGDRIVPETGKDDLYATLASRVADIRAHGCRAAC